MLVHPYALSSVVLRVDRHLRHMNKSLSWGLFDDKVEKAIRQLMAFSASYWSCIGNRKSTCTNNVYQCEYQVIYDDSTVRRAMRILQLVESILCVCLRSKSVIILDLLVNWIGSQMSPFMRLMSPHQLLLYKFTDENMATFRQVGGSPDDVWSSDDDDIDEWHRDGDESDA